MPFALSFETFGDVGVMRRLERMEHNTQDLTPAFEKMHTSFLAIERKQFDTQGGSGSGGWKPLKPRTVAYKARHNLDPRTLHATLRLRKGLTNKTSPDHIKEIGPHEAFFGVKDIHGAGAHQRPKPSNPLPRRRPVELTESQRRAWVRLVQQALVEA